MFFYLVCTQTISGYQCRCQQPYVWPIELCIIYGACDSIVGDECGCIKGLPPEGQLCRLNDFQAGRFQLLFRLPTTGKLCSLHTELNNSTLNRNHSCLFLNFLFFLTLWEHFFRFSDLLSYFISTGMLSCWVAENLNNVLNVNVDILNNE